MDTSDKMAFLSTIPPFNQLPDQPLVQAAEALTLRHFSGGQTLLKRWHNPAYFYIVVDGVVGERDADGIVGRYGAGDTFDSRALIEGRSQHDFVTWGSCSCYVLPARLFLTLIQNNRSLWEFYYEDLSRKLDALVTLQQQREAASFMLARIGESRFHPPVFVSPDTSLQEAVQIMKARQITALLVKRADQVGIFTGRDVREKSVLMGMPDTTPIGEIASYGLITLPRNDFLFNALAIMTKRAIRHIVITDGAEIVGILEQLDLLNYLANHSYIIANQIEHAASQEDLQEASNNIPQLIKSLYDRGVKPRYIARLVNDLNRKIFRQLYERLTPPEVLKDACLIVMGSEGRGEQLLRTDQDNALILRDETLDKMLTSPMQTFTETLVELGYPRCPGNIMVSNPAWAKAQSAFKQDIFGWINQPDETAFMNLAIFYDALAVAGDSTLLEEIKGYLFQLIQNQKTTLQYFARAILSFPTPLGVFNRFVVEKTPAHRQELDIKKGGIFPIVHGVRSLALEYQLAETNTIARIQALSGKGPFDERFTADLIEAFDFMCMLRLREQLAKRERGITYDNYVNPGRLNKLERNLLKDSLKIVKEFKAFISYHFKLTMVS